MKIQRIHSLNKVGDYIAAYRRYADVVKVICKTCNSAGCSGPDGPTVLHTAAISCISGMYLLTISFIEFYLILFYFILFRSVGNRQSCFGKMEEWKSIMWYPSLTIKYMDRLDCI